MFFVKVVIHAKGQTAMGLRVSWSECLFLMTVGGGGGCTFKNH